MQLPKIPASVVLAAAFGAVVTCAFQWAYNGFLTAEKSTRKRFKNCPVKRGSRRKGGSKFDSKVNESCLPENVVQELIVSERESQWGEVLEHQKNDGTSAEMGEIGRSNANFHLEVTVTDDGLTEAFGGETDKENLKRDGVLQEDVYNRASGPRFVETRDQDTSAKSQTADKCLATEESGYCKGDEDIVFVDRKLMKFMVHTMADMEKRLQRYEDGNSEQISLLQQLFQ